MLFIYFFFHFSSSNKFQGILGTGEDAVGTQCPLPQKQEQEMENGAGEQRALFVIVEETFFRISAYVPASDLKRVPWVVCQCTSPAKG